MWELIQANKRKSIILFVGMGAVLILLGFLIGKAVFPEDHGITGIFIAIFIWVIMSFVSYFSGSSILLATTGAKLVNWDKGVA